MESYNEIKIIIILILLAIIIYIYKKNEKNKNEINFFNRYINICKKLRKINHIQEKGNKIPFLSICILIYNMEKYIEKAILSILNQTFKNYEIIIINDNSNDKSNYLIEKLKLNNYKIKIINHERNIGIFASRVDGVYNANGKYVIFLDSDDLLLNPFLFEKLYKYNFNYNLDIIEFTVYEQYEDSDLYYPSFHRANHFHNFKKSIISQPELSNLIFFDPESGNYSDVICRCIWNKMIKKKILIKTINFIGEYYYKKIRFNFAEDTILNIINYEFASNYSNINLPGYMYNIRKESMSHGNKFKFILNYNMLLYYELFYKYVNYFNKDRNYLFHDLKCFSNYLTDFNDFNKTFYIKKIKLFFNKIINDAKISLDFKRFIMNLTLYLK